MSSNFIFAQTPDLYSWVRNLTGATGYNSIPSNVQSIYYTSTDVYVSCTCIPGYSIGPWSGNPNVASNQNFCFKITRSPQQNTGTATAVGNGHIGVWTNGVSIFNVSDAMSYNNQGIWFRNAYYWEGSGFDNCLGHPQQQGEYHHHVSPKCLYDASDSTHHSPIIGYAFDGYPVYGAYAYTNTNGTGAIKRMKSSYSVSSATTRTNGPAVSGTYPAGCFIQDYIYTAGSGDLDARNGRFCVTPEFPSGTYAYFVTIDATLTPTFPYTFYGTYYGVVQSGNTGGASGHNTIPGTATQYSTARTPSITIAASSSTICSNASVTFTPTVTNAGTSPVYQWKKNNVTVATGSSYTTSALVNGDVITCTLTSNAYYLTSSTAASNSITMTVQNAPSVSGFTPVSGVAGTTVTISGTNFNTVSSVKFNSVPALFTVNTGSQISATVPAGATSGTITVINSCGNVISTSSFTVVPQNVTLNLKVFLEGLYLGNGLMRGVLSSTVCDSITVKLAVSNSPHAIAYTIKSTIGIDGTGNFSFPSAVLNNSYYIVVNHRNSVETWTAAPVNFSSSSVSYDFSTPPQ
jgi:hypothetical protein